MKLFNDLHYLPMSRIIFPLGFIFPLDSFCLGIFLHPPPPPLEIVKWLTLFTHAPYHFPPGFILPPYNFAPYYFAPWKFFNDLHYLPMSRIIFPPGFILPPGEKLFNDLHYLPNGMSRIILPPWIGPFGLGCCALNRMLGQMLRCSDFTIVMFIFVLV